MAGTLQKGTQNQNLRSNMFRYKVVGLFIYFRQRFPKRDVSQRDNDERRHKLSRMELFMVNYDTYLAYESVLPLTARNMAETEALSLDSIPAMNQWQPQTAS